MNLQKSTGSDKAPRESPIVPPSAMPPSTGETGSLGQSAYDFTIGIFNAIAGVVGTAVSSVAGFFPERTITIQKNNTDEDISDLTKKGEDFIQFIQQKPGEMILSLLGVISGTVVKHAEDIANQKKGNRRIFCI